MDDIEALIAGFEDCSLPAPRWTHAAHLTVALAYLHRYSREEATARMRAAIQRYNAAQGGDPAAYHETITLAWLEIVALFMAEHRGEPLPELARKLVERCGDKHYLLRFYTREALMSPEARAGWVAPDKRPLDAAEATSPL